MKILLTGANGLIGRAVCANARSRAIDIFPIFRTSGHLVDLARISRAGTIDLLEAIRPDAVVHLAGASCLEECDREPELARALHVDWPGYALEWCRDTGALFVYPSSIAVFNGRQDAPYREDDPCEPLSYYGMLKSRGESLARSYERHLIFRAAAVFGVSERPDGCFPEQLLRGIPRGRRFRLFTDVPFAPIDSGSLARALLDLVSGGASGVFHLAGAEICSRWEFGARLAELAGLDPAALIPGRLPDADLPAPRPRNQVLDSRKAARVLGRPLPGIDEALASFLHEWAKQPAAAYAEPDLAGSRR